LRPPVRAALLAAGCTFVCVAASAFGKPKPADIVLQDGRVYTVNAKEPVVEAVAIRDGKIIDVGTTEELKHWIAKATTVMQLKGHPVYPGFKDSHAHLLRLGLSHLNGEYTGDPTPDVKRRAWSLAFVDCLRAGITAVDEAGLSYDDVELIKQIAAQGLIPIRLYVMLSGWPVLKRYEKPEIGLGEGHLTVRAVDLHADGPAGELRTATRYALDHGFQVATDAIDARSNRLVLDLYEHALSHDLSHGDLRWRIERAQVLDDADIPRFAKLGVIASMQTVHATSDRPWAADRIGIERVKESAYAWRKLLESGAIIANGTDAPVQSIDPIRNFYAAVTRMDEKGQPPGGFDPEERMTREEALRSYTIEGAYATFTERESGSIEVGKNADLVILSQDIMRVPEADILKVKAEYTIAGGRIYSLRAK